MNDECQTVYLRKEPMRKDKEIPRLAAAGARFLRADFCWRDWSPKSIKNIWDSLR